MSDPSATDAPSATTHVCIKVPQPKDALRRT